MLKKVLISIFLVSIFFLPTQLIFAKNLGESQINQPILFYGQGCPHCVKVHNFLKKDNIQVKEYEIYHNTNNLNLFNKTCDEKNIPLMERGVPMLFIGNQSFIGDTPIIDAITNYIENKIINQPTEIKDEKNGDNEKKSLNIFLVIGAAIVDAINPCAFAVLIILLTTILTNTNRKKALFSGLLFSLSIFISYFLMGLGLYKAIASVELSYIFLKIVAVLAILIGLFNLKDFLWYGKGFLMEVPMSWRPKLKSIITGVTNPIGAFLIGFVVSLFLLPCTSGPYFVILSLLGNQETFYKAIMYLVLYNIIFVTPMVAITSIVYFGFNPEQAEKFRINKVKILHLIAGILMLSMGIYIWLVY